MSIPQPRAVRRAGVDYFGPQHDAVAALLARISAADAQQIAAAAAAPVSNTQIVALGAAWRAARRANLSKQVERSSEAIYAAAQRGDELDPRNQQRAADALANAAIATCLGPALETRYASALLAVLTVLEAEPRPGPKRTNQAGSLDA